MPLREEAHAVLLPKIKARSTQNFETAQEIIQETDAFIARCKNLKDELYRRGEAIDSTGTFFTAKKDKTITTQYLIHEQQGAQLKQAMLDLRARYLEVIEGHPEFVQRIVLAQDLDYPKDRADSWEEYQFTALPLGAAFPIIGVRAGNAEISEQAVLEFLSQE